MARVLFMPSLKPSARMIAVISFKGRTAPINAPARGMTYEIRLVAEPVVISPAETVFLQLLMENKPRRRPSADNDDDDDDYGRAAGP